MRGRRMWGHRAKFALVAGTVTAVGIVMPAAAAQATATSPAHVTISEARCADLSGLGAVLPGLSALDSVPTVRADITPTASDHPLPYEVQVDGVRKSGGTVTGGHTTSSFDVPNGKSSHVVVLSNGIVLAERTVTANC